MSKHQNTAPLILFLITFPLVVGMFILNTIYLVKVDNTVKSNNTYLKNVVCIAQEKPEDRTQEFLAKCYDSSVKDNH